MIYNIVFQVYSKAIQVCVYFFSIICHYTLSQDTVYSSLCCTVNPCCLFYIWEYLLIRNCTLSLPLFPFGNYRFGFYVCESVSVL